MKFLATLLLVLLSAGFSYSQDEEVKVGKLYPNPVRDVAYLEYSLPVNSEGKIIIYNVLGTKVAEFDLIYHTHKIKIPTSDYRSGVYFYTLYVDNKDIITKKFIVDR